VIAVLLFYSAARGEAAPVSRVLEIRSYTLKPGTRDRFHALVERDALPMLRRGKIDVVAYGPSLHDADSYYLMRAFPSVEERQRTEDAFYGSDEWRQGPREAVLAAIDSYTTAVIRVDDATLRGLRGAERPEPDHLTALLELNRDYIRSVQTSDVKRFKEILADDFLCSLPDGALIDREGFLEHTALPATISNLEGPRRQRPAHGRLRDHSRPDHVHHPRRTPRDGPLHGRMGAPGRPLARRFRARHAAVSHR
jgi:hypothetical protein